MFHRSALLAISFFAATASAQVVGGTISGLVTDSAGAIIPDVQITIRNQETGGERHLLSDASGAYAAPSIPVGAYTISVSRDGFAPQSRSGISLTVGQAIRIDLTLHPGSVIEQITVTDVPSAVNLSTQQTSGLVNERQVKDLPLNGRSYDQLITLNPAAVNYTAQRSGSVGTSNSSVGSMFAISGRRPQDNLYLLNGIEYTGASLINVTPGGTSGQLLGVEAVREFNVVSDTYSASYGKRQGAQISIVTASGTNNLHGSAYEFLRNSFFDSRNYFDQARIPNFQRNNYGASLGGPVRTNKLFLFGNYEGYRQNLGITDVTLVPDTEARQGLLPDPANPGGPRKNYGLAAGVRPLLNLWPTQNGPELLDAKGRPTGIAEAFSSPTQHIREDFGTLRFDANLTARDLLFAVYTVDDSVANTPTQNPLSLINESLREQVVSVQEQHVFSAHLLNTARIGYSRASFFFLGDIPSSVQADTPGFLAGRPTGAIVIAGSTASNGSSQITGAGANVGSNNATSRNLYTLDDHVFYSRSRHQVEAGVWLQSLQSNDNLAQNQYGQASFASLATFLQGTVKTFTVVPNPTPLNWRSFMGSAYLEDTWQLTPAFEIRGGIRFESTNGWNEAHGRASQYGFTDGVINTTPTTGTSALSDNRAKILPEPRLGIAWNVFGTGKTSLRSSIGLHHSLLDNLDYRLDQAAPYNTTLSYSNVPVASPVSGAPGLISPSNIQTDISTPAVVSYTFSIEQQLDQATSLTIGYVGSHGYHQILSEDQNEPASIVCSPASGCPLGASIGTIYYPTIVKANPLVANTTSWTSGGSSNYNALEVDLRRNLSHGLQLRANYTFAKNLDDGSAWNTSVSANTPAFVSYPANPSLDYGPAATDIRHLAAFNATYELPVGRGHLLLPTTSSWIDHAVSGWSLSTIATLQTGFPFSPQLGYNPTGSGDTRNPVRPNVNPDFHGSLYTHGSTATRVSQFFAPTAFTAPAYGTLGDLGRDTLTGPGYADWDLSLLKSTTLTERTRLQFRAEFFNVLNHTNLQTPNEVVYTGGPTQGPPASQTAAAVQSPTAGVITAASTSRQIQLALKLIF
ncbi:carboxypeptidase-like regulatory domain-containing protein [Granulicella sp. S190]|uniref:TonB-dependent receptor n=1 Tax=Granulicella sp. S190 TaxID=1747226 RepID=UPI00131DE792|nr:carboxypeptidase-like regulatory domain-containing protein [Granulicella sp. S190]